MKYRPEIDGLRAVAVIPVIFFHAGFSLFSGGFVGVDVFFVISGYLITTIILSEMEQGKFSLVNFYERRARRIIPALFVVMATSLLFAWLWLLPKAMQDFSRSLVAVSSFWSNILFWRETDYWDVASELKPLLHTWSLAVEEQYYVLFPLFLMLMWSFRKRWILATFMLVAGLSLAVAQWGVSHNPVATFYLLPTRAWELAIGAGIAFYFLYRKEVLRILFSHKLVDEAFGLVGLCMIGYSVFVFDKSTPFPGLHALVPTIGTGLIILFSSPETISGRLLSSRSLVFIGLISYSAYLWHQPLFAFARYNEFPEPSPWLLSILIVATFILAYITWWLIEKPFRNKAKYSRKKIFWFVGIGSLCFIAVGAAGNYYDGFKHRSIYTNLLVKKYQPDYRVLQQQSWEYLRELSGNKEYGVDFNEYDRKLWFKENDSRRNLLLVGNSHSKDLFNILVNSDYAMRHFQVARFGVQISDLVNKKTDLFASPNYKQAEIVMIVSRYTEADPATLDRVVEMIKNDGKKVAIVKNIYEFDFYAEKNLADYLLRKDYLKKYRKGTLTAPEVVNKLNIAYYERFATHERPEHIEISDKAIDAIARKHSDILILDRMDYACDKVAKKCFSANTEFEKYYYDYGHNTLAGAMFFGKRVDQVGWLSKL